jgi:hypothetical protein
MAKFMEQKQKLTKKTNKKETIIISSIACVSLALGVTAGIVFHNMFSGGDIVDYDNLKADAVDTTKLLSRYSKVSDGNYDGFSECEKANIALSLYSKEEHTFCQSIGVAQAGSLASQTIRGSFIRNGTKYFEESLSYSNFVNIADRMYEEGDSTVKYHGKTGSSVEVGVFEDTTGTTYTNSDYATLMGRNVHTTCSYIISDQTVLLDGATNTSNSKNSGVPTSCTKLEGGGYTVELELNNVYGVLNYVTQMKTISDLKRKPTFEYVHLTLDLNAKLEIQSMETHEYYTATTSAGIGSSIEGKLRTVYETGGNYEIPELNTPLTYRSEQ